MTRDALIGLDAGTSMIKAVAFDLEGHEIAMAARPNRISHVAEGGVEQEMSWTWDASAQTLRELVQKLAELGHRAAALASLEIAVIAATIALVLGTCAGFAMNRFGRFRGRLENVTDLRRGEGNRERRADARFERFC